MEKKIDELNEPKRPDYEILEEILHDMIENGKELREAIRILRAEVEEKKKQDEDI